MNARSDIPSLHGRRILLADLDPQGAIGLSLAKGDTELAGLAELLSGVVSSHEAVIATRLAGLSLLPRGRLDATDVDSFEAAVAQPGPIVLGDESPSPVLTAPLSLFEPAEPAVELEVQQAPQPAVLGEEERIDWRISATSPDERCRY